MFIPLPLIKQFQLIFNIIIYLLCLLHITLISHQQRQLPIQNIHFLLTYSKILILFMFDIIFDPIHFTFHLLQLIHPLPQFVNNHPLNHFFIKVFLYNLIQCKQLLSGQTLFIIQSYFKYIFYHLIHTLLHKLFSSLPHIIFKHLRYLQLFLIKYHIQWHTIILSNHCSLHQPIQLS